MAIVAVGLVIFALIDLAQVKSSDVRGGSRFLWLVAIILLPAVGAVLWLFLGRARDDEPRHFGPDDDPDFLRGIQP